MTNKEKVSAVFFDKGPWSLFNESDKEWLMASANEGDLQAACLLVNGMHNKYNCWIERLVDEDTNEKVDIERRTLVDGTTFEPDDEAAARLRQMVFDGKERLSNEELWWARYHLNTSSYRDNTPLYLELVRRGEEDATSFIDDPTILQELCDQGNKTAMEEMGYKYFYGDDEYGVSQDYAEAFILWRKAADRGYADAQCDLGNGYYDGEGVSQDFHEAVRWYRKAAEQGHATSQFKLGVCYANGEGVTQDYAEAVKWWRKAAEQGSIEAEIALQGLGTE